MGSRRSSLGKDSVLEVRLLASGEVVSTESGDAVDFEFLKSEQVLLRLGPGSVEPFDRRQEEFGLRNLFLARVRELELAEQSQQPQRPLRVLQALAELPYQEFLRAKITEDDLFLLLEDERGEGSHNLPQKLSGVREAVHEWARSTNLNAGWCVERAVLTLWLWRESPEALKNLQWENGTRLVMTVVGDIPAPESVCRVHDFPAWFPDAEPLESYEKAIRHSLRELIEEAFFSRKHSSLSLVKPITLDSMVNELVAAVVAAAKVQSMSAYMEARDQNGDPVWSLSKARRTLAKRIDWTIECIIRGIGIDMMTETKADKGEISKGISEVLELIGLPKRGDFKRGRPKGSKDSVTSDRLK